MDEISAKKIKIKNKQKTVEDWRINEYVDFLLFLISWNGSRSRRFD